MTDWQEKPFIERADLFIKIMNQRWPWTERFVDGITRHARELAIQYITLLRLNFE